MDYEVNVDVHRWKKTDIVSEEELVSEGVVIKDWLKQNLLVIEAKVNLDLNGDGVVDKKDASIAGKVLSASRKKGKR